TGRGDPPLPGSGRPLLQRRLRAALACLARAAERAPDPRRPVRPSLAGGHREPRPARLTHSPPTTINDRNAKEQTMNKLFYTVAAITAAVSLFAAPASADSGDQVGVPPR